MMRNSFFIDMEYVVYRFFEYLVSKLEGIVYLNRYVQVRYVDLVNLFCLIM